MVSRARYWSERTIEWLLGAAAGTSCVIVALIFVFIMREAAPFIGKEGFGALFATEWLPKSMMRAQFGLLPLISGSFVITGLAALLAVPLGVAIAVYVAEIARPTEREFLKPFIELFAAIPSVVLGFLGIVLLAPAVKAVFGLNTGLNALTGALILALMALPTIISIAEDAIRAVPAAYREASLALGAKRQQTIWMVVVPAALPGITAAVMLGLGRVIGETMVVLMVTGNTPKISLWPFDPMRTMTATIAAETGEVEFGSLHYNALFCVGVVLLFTTLVLNLTAVRMSRRFGAR